ncbi:MAG: ketopantoate reductase family protein [Candidatus Heimdallarchaeaceae archaeon]
MAEKLRFLIYGAGAIGGSIGGWLAKVYPHVTLLARGGHAHVMQKKGLLLHQHRNLQLDRIPVNVIETLNEGANFNVVILAVKNYQLEEAAQDIKNKLGSEVIIVALQNGVKNQEVLKKYFKKVIYGVVCYNAWILEPGHIVYQSQGPIILGTTSNRLEYSIEEIHGIFNYGVKTSITDRLQDAVHCKIVLNLTNALFTLTGLNYVKSVNYRDLAFLTAEILNEGIKVISIAGYKEHKLGNLPTWKTIKLTKKVPTFLRTWIFKMKASHSFMNSMMQDVIQKRRNVTELDTLNGYILELAKKHDVQTPYNQSLFDLCRETFYNEPFEPLPADKIILKARESI